MLAASSSSRVRFAGASVQPAGLWKLGIVCSSSGVAPAERLLERGHVDPVVLERDRGHVGAELAQREQGAVVGGRLDDRALARADQRRKSMIPASSDPLVTMTRSGATPCRPAIQSRSGG